MAKILVVGPHPDDQEIGMGGTVALLADQGHDVLLLDMTDGSPTPRGDRASRLVEAERAARALSSPSGGVVRRVLLDLPNRRVEHTIDARHRVAGVIRAHQAQVIFSPHPLDAHPDHVATTAIVRDARFDAKLTKVDMPTPPGFERVGPPIYAKWHIHYYCSHLRRVPDPMFIVDISATAERKRAAIEAYRTQFADNPINAGFPRVLEAQDAYMGSRIGVAAGEGFFSHEPLGLASLGGWIGL
jgi:bacillithiol biosynthesis deacetylase BshB1